MSAAFAAVVGGDTRRLQDLGLLVPAEDLVLAARVALSVNGLAAGRLKPPLTEASRQRWPGWPCRRCSPSWGGAEDGLRRPYAADIELPHLALPAG